MKQISSKRLLIATLGAVAIFGLGTMAANAVAAAPATPDSVTEQSDYPENASGMTFGSAATAKSPDAEPDLISALATNGKEGYILKSDLEWGTGFSSPEEALRWQEENRGVDHVIPVYEQDGKTVIGEFVLVNSEGFVSSEK